MTNTTLPNFNPSKDEAVAEVKIKTEDLITFVRQNFPDNHQRQLALDAFEAASMWAVKSKFV